MCQATWIITPLFPRCKMGIDKPEPLWYTVGNHKSVSDIYLKWSL
jgi:hypothetical protein